MHRLVLRLLLLNLILMSISKYKPAPANPGTPLEIPSLPRKEKKRRREWKQTLPPAKFKSRWTEGGTNAMEFVQIKLYHSKAATAVLCQQLAEGMAVLALIQGPNKRHN
jgi:ABC-type oligopeptide transport system substrate-binding subunit